MIEIAEDFHRRLQLIYVGVMPDHDSKLTWFLNYRLIEKVRNTYKLTMLGMYVMFELEREIQNDRAQSQSA